MRALTLHAGWAWAICHLGKRIENRPWKIPASMIGERIAIHAGANIGARKGSTAAMETIQRIEQAARAAGYTGDVWAASTEAPTRAIVATAVLESCSMNPDDAGGWAVPGQYGWVLADVRVLAEPVPVQRGSLGLWRIDSKTTAAIEETL